MKNKLILPLTGFWLTTVAASYYIGNSQESNTASSLAEQSEQQEQQRGRSHISGGKYGSSSSARSARNSTSKRTTSNFSSAQSNSSIKAISELNNPLDRSRQLLSLIDTLGPQDFESVVADFRALGMTRERMGEYSMLLHAWGKADPQGALAYAQSLSRPDFATKEVLSSWANSNPDAALSWARDNHEGEKANPYLVGIIKGIASTNPTLATEVLQELPYSAERGDALRSMVPSIAKLGVDGAEQWINGIDDPQLKGGASAYLADHFSKLDPEVGVQWIAKLDDPDARQRAIGEVTENYTRKDASAAKVWIDSLPYEDQLKAGPDFVNAYAAQDAHAAADWLDERANSDSYQLLLQEFAQGATRSDPVLALNYGNELNDESSRSRTVGRALWTLYKQDKEQAREWIQNNDVPPRVQRHVKRMMEDNN